MKKGGLWNVYARLKVVKANGTVIIDVDVL